MLGITKQTAYNLNTNSREESMKTIYRKRVRLNRYGISNGECYRGVHMGKHSWYVLKGSSRYCGLTNLRDVQGSITVNGE